MSEQGPARELRIVITVDDFARAMGFYREALGLPLIRAWQEGDGGGALLDAGHGVIELLSSEQAAMVDEVETGSRHGGASLRVALEVDDSAVVADHLVHAGAQRLGGPFDTPWGHRSVRLRAPGGVQLTLFTVLEPPAEAG
jgi:catechol 2,3-dioxygenase-like lactoylglutathione lyase family enzyme